MESGNLFKLWFMPAGIALIMAGCGGIQLIPMDIEGQTYPYHLMRPRPYAGLNESDIHLPVDRSIKGMVTDICAGNTDVYSLGPFYYAESTDGFIDGYILNEGRRYTLNRKLIQTRTNIVIWSETRKWFDPERWLLGPKQTSEITRPVPPRYCDELLNNYNLKE